MRRTTSPELSPYYCSEEVHDTFGAGVHQCGNRRKEGSDFCGTHSPKAVARRRAKSDAHWNTSVDKLHAPSRRLKRLESINHDLLAALEAGLNYLPACKGKEGDDCGIEFPYKPKCLFVKARAAIKAAKEA